jgi:hypothetical protein
VKHMPVLEEMHGLPTIVATWSCTRATTNETSATPTRHMHATASDCNNNQSSLYKVTSFQQCARLLGHPVKENVDLSQPDDRILLMTE